VQWCSERTQAAGVKVLLDALRKIVEKEIDRSDATVPGDDKIGSRVSWWFAGSARYPSDHVRHHLAKACCETPILQFGG
jgi:hypothetical protein